MLTKHCGNHFTVYHISKSLCYIPKLLHCCQLCLNKAGKQKSDGTSKKAHFVFPPQLNVSPG